MEGSVPLVRVLRGGLVESVHRGAWVLVQGPRVVAGGGDRDALVYLRSAAKPFQAMVAVTSGAVARFGLGDAHLAVAAGSHDAAPGQLAVVRSLLAAAGLAEDALGCGGHWSIDPLVGRQQVASAGAEAGRLPPIWSNCSGKHAAMLAAARALGAPIETYLEPTHPVQVEITRIVAAFAGIPAATVHVGTDGCGAPAHAVPLVAIAHSMARLGRPDALPADLAGAARRVGAAMHAHPDLVAGPRRFDTDLMRSAAEVVLAKGGAEGVHALAIPGRGLGLAFKAEDGRDRGYRQPVIALLAHLGVVAPDAVEALAARHDATLRNWSGRVVGRIESAVRVP